MNWVYGQTPIFTSAGSIAITDTPSAERDGGPDGTLVINLAITDSPSAQRSAGSNGTIDLTFTDTPSAQRSSGPDGTLVITTILSDTPSALRSSGPSGSADVGVTLTDSPTGERDYGPAGSADIGVSFGSDTPAALRNYGPDGVVAIDLGVTDRPSALRAGGPTGAVLLGIVLMDTPSAFRCSGPDGSVFADVGGGISLTDTPRAIRYGGPEGSVVLGVTLAGDLPSGYRLGGLDGSLAIDVVLSNLPAGYRLSGPNGLLDSQLSDSPSGLRAMGPDGAMGIALPVTGDLPSGYRLGGPGGLISIGVGVDIVAGSTPPSGLRYGGPTGEVLLALLPSKPPYIPVSPLIAPTYSLWVADTRTGKMLWSLPASTFSWDSKLNDVGTIRATLSVEQTWDALSDQDERDPRILIREILTGPWRFSLVLKWGYNSVWAGPYLSMTRPTPSSVEINGAEISKMFSRRILVKPGAVSATDITADTAFTNTNKRHVAAALISQAMTGTGNNLPITVNDPGGIGTDSRIYYGYDLANYWEKLQALSAEVDGPEIRFDPQIVTGVDGDYLNWAVQIGTPHLGRGMDDWVFDYDVNTIIGFDGDGSNMSLGVWSSGAGQSRDKLVAHTTDTRLLNIGWPMIETTDSSHSSEVNYPVLSAYSSALLAAHKQPLVAFKMSVPIDSDPMVGTYHVGEDFAIDIHGDPVITDGFYTRRIAAISGSEKPWVAITDADPLPVGSL